MSKITRRMAVKAMGAGAALAAAGEIDVLGHNPDTKKMKVLLINGSPRREGNTACLLQEAAARLGTYGIETELVHIGAKPIRGCNGCGKCGSIGKCIFEDDIVNSVNAKMAGADALIVGSPVYFGVPAGPVLTLIQRLAVSGGRHLTGKPVSAVTVCRRGGASAAFQTLQMPFQMLNMPIVTSQYWNIGFGLEPGEVKKDAEGLQTMRTLADNMAYMLKQFRTGDANPPKYEQGIFTNFIR